MNDPHVDALIYRVLHSESIKFQGTREIERSEFRVDIEDDQACFHMKEHFATEQEARAAVQPFIDQWEFEEALRVGPGQFGLSFDKSVITDLQPTPGVHSVSAGPIRWNFTVSTPEVTVSRPYPEPPSASVMDIRNRHVVVMFDQYVAYRNGRDLPVVAQICCEEFEKLGKHLKDAAARHGISHKLIRKVTNIANTKGGQQGRHASALNNPLTQDEIQFLDKAIIAMIVRAAKVAADPNQPMEQITVGNLRTVSP